MRLFIPMLVKSFILSLVFLLMTAEVSSQWKLTEGPSSVSIHSFLNIGQDSLLAGSEGAVYLSVDDGEHWNLIGEGLNISDGSVRGIVEMENSIFIATDRGCVFKLSEDQQWISVSDGLPGFIFCMIEAESTLYVGTLDGVFASSNSGNNWFAQSNGLLPGSSVYSLAIMNSNIYAGVKDGGVYRSNLGSIAWNNISSGGLNYSNVSTICIENEKILAGTDRGVFQSLDHGNSWTLIKTFGYQIGVTQIVVSGSNIFVGTNLDGIHYSPDMGGTWQEANNGITGSTVWALGLKDDYIFSGIYADGVFRATTDEMNWARKNIGLPHSWCNSIESSSSNLFSGMTSGIYKLEPSSISWGAPITSRSSAGWISCAGENIYICAYSSACARIYRSTDSGLNWESIQNIGEHEYCGGLSSYHNSVICGINYGQYGYPPGGRVMLSSDTGNTWSNIGDELPIEGNIFTVYMDGETIFAAIGTEIYYSSNSGADWEVRNTGIPDMTKSKSFVKMNNRFYVATNKGIYYSENSGLIWEAHNNGLTNENILAITCNDTIIFAGNTDGVFLSGYDDLVWTDYTKNLPDYDYLAGLEIFDDAIFAATWQKGIWKHDLIDATGIWDSYTSNREIIAYPNPASDHITIELPPGVKAESIEIYDLGGKLVVYEEVKGHSYTLDVGHLPKGLYITRILTDRGVNTEKLLIQ